MITILGNLCNNGLVIAELLSRYEIDSHLISTQYDPELKKNYLKYFNDSKNHYVYKKTDQTLQNVINNSNLIISNSGTIVSIGLKKYIKLFATGNVRAFNISTGSDFSEYISEKGLLPSLFRYHVRNSDLNWVFPVSNVRDKLQALKLKNIFISRHPFFLKPLNSVQNDKQGLTRKKDKIVFFHPSNLDWGLQDNKEGRNSTKGNDKFLKAFIQASKINPALHCVIIRRGSDQINAQEIIKSNDAETCFTWIDPLSSEEVGRYFSYCDLVVDQFMVGCPGMIAMESMAQGKPVMIHIDKNYWPLVYDEEPPVINCHTEEEIYEAILKWADRKKLQELGNHAEKWVRRYHDVHTADFSEFILRVCLAAGLEWPRTDLAKADKI